MYQILQCKIEVNLFFIRFHFLLSYCRPTRHWANAMMKAHVHGHCLSLMQCEASSASPSEYIGCKLVSHLPRLSAVPLLLTVLMAICLPYFAYFALFRSSLPFASSEMFWHHISRCVMHKGITAYYQKIPTS